MEKASEDARGQVDSRLDYCIERVDTVYNAIEEHVDEISDMKRKLCDVIDQFNVIDDYIRVCEGDPTTISRRKCIFFNQRPLSKEERLRVCSSPPG